jgi:hypothetical protein
MLVLFSALSKASDMPIIFVRFEFFIDQFFPLIHLNDQRSLIIINH